MALLAAASSISCALSRRSAQVSPPGTHSSRVADASPCAGPLLPPSAAMQSGRVNVELGGSALAGALFAALASSNSAMAAQEMMNLAATADDNRGLVLLITLVPAVGWVLFNILQPALNQLDRMRSAKALAVGVGMGAAASLLVPAQADAVQELTSLAADNDSRGLLLLIVLAPAIGWVLFNILKPALNQLDKMNAAKGVMGAVGLSSALLLSAGKADAAVQEITRLADSLESSANSDARGLLLLGVLVPAIGWVLFNILQPALNQFDRMKVSKGIAAAVGLGAASALLPSQADAVQELATVADNDARGTLLLAVLVPAIGWVLFNILQPALNQFDKMKAQK